MTTMRPDTSGTVVEKTIPSHLSAVCGVLACTLALLALLGWIMDWPTLSSFGESHVPMAPSTAALFLLEGCLLALLPRMLQSPGMLRIGRCIGAGIPVVSMILLVSSSHGLYFHSEHLGIPIEGTHDGLPLGHMSPVTALCFLLTGTALLPLLFSTFQRPVHVSITLFFCLSSLWLSAILVVAYALGGPILYGSGAIPPALPTSLAFLFLSSGLLLATTGRIWQRNTRDDVCITGGTQVLLILFLVLATGVVSIGYLYFRHFQSQLLHKTEDELNAIAELKITDIARWRQERLGDAAVFYDNDAFATLVRRFLDAPPAPEAQSEIRTWLRQLRHAYAYSRTSLFSPSGAELIADVDAAEAAVPPPLPDIQEAARSGKIRFFDFYRESPGKPIRLSVLVPIRNTMPATGILGVLALQIDPDTNLYPLLRRWPTPSATAETLLVRREGDEVLFLNNLRFHSDAALNLRFPLSRRELPAAQAVLGKDSVIDGIDYRGVRVIAAVRSIPDSPWSMVARGDSAEVYAPLQDRLWIMSGFVMLLLFGVGAGVYGLWMRQKNHLYRERDKAAEEIRHSENTLRAILDNARDGILAVSTHDRKIMVSNEAICRMLGYSRAELLSFDVTAIHPEPALPGVLAQFERVIRSELTLASDVPMKRKDGTVFLADINTAHVVLNGVECLLGVFRDITERKRAEARIAHLNAVLRGIRNVNQLITHEKNTTNLIREACKLLVDARGFHSASICLLNDDGKTFSAHVSEGDISPEVRGMFIRGEIPDCAQRILRDAELIVRHCDDPLCADCPGTRQPAERDVVALRLGHENHLYGFMICVLPSGMCNDADEQELLAEVAGDIAFALHGISIQARHEKLEEQFRQAQKMEAVGRLAGGIAHDFNNMLSIIIGYCDLIHSRSGGASPMMREVTHIQESALRAATLTAQLLAFSRKQILEVEVLDLNEVILGLNDMLRRLIGEDIELSAIPKNGLDAVKADRGQIEQIIMNLSINARDAMPSGGMITIETENALLDEEYAATHPETKPGRYVMLAVSDTGLGMNRETLDHLFEPFFTTKPKGKGTGLGLSTVYGIVKQSGGSIWVYSEPERGTTFKIYLPSVEACPQKTSLVPPVAEARQGGITILAVEDVDALRNLLAEMLESGGYTVLAASNGKEALEICRQHADEIGLVITCLLYTSRRG